MRLKKSKSYSSYSLIQYQPNGMRALGTTGEYRLLLFLVIDQVLEMLWHFEILAWESSVQYLENGDRSAKRVKMWDSQSNILHM